MIQSQDSVRAAVHAYLNAETSISEAIRFCLEKKNWSGFDDGLKVLNVNSESDKKRCASLRTLVIRVTEGAFTIKKMEGAFIVTAKTSQNKSKAVTVDQLLAAAQNYAELRDKFAAEYADLPGVEAVLTACDAFAVKGDNKVEITTVKQSNILRFEVAAA